SAAETTTIGAFTVTIKVFDDHQDENTVTAGVQDTTGQIDDRDRATPVDGGAFTYGQMYDDLIFAGTSAGPTGGIDLTITGGTLLASTPYLVSFYDFDSGSTAAPQPRTARWEDCNHGAALGVSTSVTGSPLPAA